MITTKKIGKRTEYTESVRHSCGHTIKYVTLSYKMERRQVAQKRQSPCAKCQLADLLNAPGNAQQLLQREFYGEGGGGGGGVVVPVLY